jgi:salicylate biosynthesis isochorismate synthase/menaquinone-specific isochorismate synthase
VARGDLAAGQGASPASTRQAPSPFAIPDKARKSLAASLARATRSARRHGERLVAASWRLQPGVDPSAVVLASRRPGEPWMCFEQPDRDAAALATLGGVLALEDHGPGRFERVAQRWRRLAAAAIAEPPQGPPGSGLVITGGFAFADDGAAALHWSGFAPASLIVPEVALARRGEEVWCTVAALARGDDLPEELLERIELRLASLRAHELPLLDPHPAERHRVAGALSPEHYEAAVARAVELIRAGKIEKIVLAREVEVHAPESHDIAAVYGVLRSAFAGCFVIAVGRGESSFIAASPELLIRREGLRASTLALAGSVGRSADPAVDDHLGERMLRSPKDRQEHTIVAQRIERELRRHAVWVTMPDEPTVVRIANIQHLATPIRAQLAHPVGAIELAGLLHPTPAVGGEPDAQATPLIPALEGIDRGWYAGPVGWSDTGGDGEFCVALRCALVHGHLARCYAGVGVVADSDPASELAETEVKLEALLPVLS